MSIFFSTVKAGSKYEMIQNRIVAAGRHLGFGMVDFEPFVNASNNGDIASIVDNTISVGRGDIVIAQYPSFFGANYDELLTNSISAVDAVLIYIVYDIPSETDVNYIRKANKILVADRETEKSLLQMGLDTSKINWRGIGEVTDEYLVQKMLLDAVEPFIIRKSNYDEYVKHKYDGTAVHVAFALHDKTGDYSVYVGVVMLSMLQHTKSLVCIHILHDETLNDDNREKLASIADKYGCVVEFHLIDAKAISVENKWIQKYSIGSMFRCYLQQVLYDIDKVIYLDADLLVLRDIKELWDTDVTDYCVAGVHDIGFERGVTPSSIITKGFVKVENYVNSGVLVMNLKNMRKKGDFLAQSLKFINDFPETTLPDQDAINYLYRDELLLLDAGWNCYTAYESQSTKAIREVVYHFMGQRDINYSEPTEYDKKYLEIMQATPWGYKAIEWRLYLGIYTGFDKTRMLQLLLKQITVGNKKKIFVGVNTRSMRNISELMNIGANDYYVGADYTNKDGMRNGIPVKDFEEIRKEEKGKFVVLVLPEAENGTALKRLDEMGLQHEVDYFVIPRLLVAKQGGYWR